MSDCMLQTCTIQHDCQHNQHHGGPGSDRSGPEHCFIPSKRLRMISALPGTYSPLLVTRLQTSMSWNDCAATIKR